MARPLTEVEVNVVRSLDEAMACKRWLGERHGTDVLALDTETSGLSAVHERLRLVQIGDTEQAWVIPFDDWAGLAKECLNDWDGAWVGHNMSFDMRFLEQNGCWLPRHRLHDTKLLAHLDNPARSNSLKPLSVALLDKHAAAGQELLNEGMRKQGWTWGTVPLEFAPYTFYAGFDTVLTARLWEHLQPVRAQYEAAYELEQKVSLICSDMAMRGMRVDRGYLDVKLAELEEYCDQVTGWIREHYGVAPGSNDAVANRLLADGVALEKRTASGKWSVDSEVLTGLDHPLARAVQGHRNVKKIASTYFRGVRDRLDGEFIRPDINPLGARTGRMSISNPPFQQLPSRGEGGTGYIVRRMVVPREGNRLVLCDLDQIEFRLLGHFAQEQVVIDAVHAGEDLHWAAARALYGPNATPAQRKQGKSGTFGVLYGAGKDKIAEQQGVSVEEAEAFLAHYARTFPAVAGFVRAVEDVARQRLNAGGLAYVTSPLGRRHPLEKDKLYTGVNYLCQGTAAEVFKQALVRMDAAGVGDYLVLPVHDEIVADVPADIADEVAQTIKDAMTDHTTYAVPIDAGTRVVENWGVPYK